MTRDGTFETKCSGVDTSRNSFAASDEGIVTSRSAAYRSNRTAAVVPLPSSDVNESVAPCSAAIS